MKKVILLLFAVGLFASCTTEPVNNEQQQESAFEYACPAPDTNCNGNPDHCDDENGDPIPDCV